MRRADCEMKPSPRHSKCGRTSNTSASALQRRQVAFPGDDAAVLVLDLGHARRELSQHHHQRLQNIERLESRYGDRAAVIAGDEFVGPAADDRRNVPRPDETVQPHVGRIEDGANRRNDRDVVAKHREVRHAQRPGRSSVSAVEGAVVSKPMAKNTTLRSGFCWAIFRASSGE